MKKILIITNSKNHSVKLVISWLTKLDQDFIRVDTDRIISTDLELILRYSDDGGAYGQLKVFSETLNLIDIKSIWYIQANWPRLHNDTQNFGEFVQLEWRYSLWSLITTFPGYWINHPIWANSLLEHNKFHQLKIALKAGLEVPDTLITNSFEEISTFCLKHGSVIACKPVHNQVIIEDKACALGIYTQMVSLADLAASENNIKKSPFIVQEYVPKRIELRITVIGKHIFCCGIESQKSDRTRHDWRRYDFQNVRHFEFQLPENIKNNILEYMKIARLNYGAIDMILTPEDKYVFLEINPNGQYGWIEHLTGMPISETFAKSLVYPDEYGIKKTDLHQLEGFYL